MSCELNHCRIAILAANGFDEAELLGFLKEFREAGAYVDLVSSRIGGVLADVPGKPAEAILATRVLENAQASDYDALVLLSGKDCSLNLSKDERAIALVRCFLDEEKPLACLGHSPLLLSRATSLRGRALACHPELRDWLTSVGGKFVEAHETLDGNWLSSPGAPAPAERQQAFIHAAAKLFSHSTPGVIRVAESA